MANRNKILKWFAIIIFTLIAGVILASASGIKLVQNPDSDSVRNGLWKVNTRELRGR